MTRNDGELTKIEDVCLMPSINTTKSEISSERKGVNLSYFWKLQMAL